MNLGATIGIIQAGMGSRRLPGKILAPLAGRPALALLTERVRAARVDEWWLATSGDPADDVTEAWGFELGLRVFRGETHDVLSRFRAIGRETHAEWLIRITASSPFLDAGLIDTLLESRDGSEAAKSADLIQLHGGVVIESETQRRPERLLNPTFTPRLPTGYRAELIRREALDQAERKIPDDETLHRRHVTSWLHTNGRVHSVPTPLSWPDRPDWRWTIDSYEDLAMARSAFRMLGSDAAKIDYPTMVARLDLHPEITEMNRHVGPNTPRSD